MRYVIESTNDYNWQILIERVFVVSGNREYGNCNRFKLTAENDAEASVDFMEDLSVGKSSNENLRARPTEPIYIHSRWAGWIELQGIRNKYKPKSTYKGIGKRKHFAQ